MGYTDNDFTPANGSGVISVGNAITGLIVFREQLIIFSQQKISRLVGNTLAMVGLPTEVKEVTDAEGNTCQNVPMLLSLVHALVLGFLTVVVLNYLASRK